tara:strand:- start:7340 stop:7864 length:525 start_codon:yes stop_codon:yes gene_type:complete
MLTRNAMKPERRISCTLVSLYKWFSDKMFDPDILRGSFVDQNSDGGIHGMMSEVFSTWVDTAVETVVESKTDAQSDNILDLIADLEEVIDESFTDEEKEELVKIIENDVIKKFLSTDLIYDIIFKSKKSMQKKIMNVIYSEENDKKFRNRLSEQFPDIELGLDGPGFDIDKDSF